MTVTLTMPEVAETVVEGTVGRWLKREGQRVERFEPLVEIVTDKVNVEVPSPCSGILAKVLAAENTTIPIGAELALIEEEAGEGVGAAPARPAPAAASQNGDVPGSRGPEPSAPRRSSPLVRRLAAEHGIDLSTVRGTGLQGRVRKQDVLEVVARGGVPAAASPAAPAAGRAAPAPPARAVAMPGLAQGDVELPLTPVRATIARRMVKSSQEVPHAWTRFEVDVTRLVELRESMKDQFQKREGVKLTYLPFFVKAVVGALKEHPELNALWAGDKVVIKKEVNVGVAVDRPEGLIVPVLRRADDKSIAGLARELDALIARARANKLSVEDVTGGSFTVNNAGSFGSISSMPIINQPQVAILATDAIVQRPVVVQGAIVVRSMMDISISFDHRALDGGQVGRFMQAVQRRLEAYGPETPLY